MTTQSNNSNNTTQIQNRIRELRNKIHVRKYGQPKPDHNEFIAKNYGTHTIWVRVK